jgi:hypothetical protein
LTLHSKQLNFSQPVLNQNSRKFGIKRSEQFEDESEKISCKNGAQEMINFGLTTLELKEPKSTDKSNNSVIHQSSLLAGSKSKKYQSKIQL